MATRYIRIGSAENACAYDDGDFATAIETTEPIAIGAPVLPGHAARLADAGSVPSGVIVMWSGAVVTIPTGWVLCDGTAGTPDLRDKFILGAGGTYAPAATGGADEVTLTDSELPAHDHGGVTGSTDTRPVNTYSTGGFTAGGVAAVISIYSPLTGHTHTIASDGDGDPFSILPPYYALCFIMKS